ncbi:outer membrane beta-barrel protein [Spirosoma montaniterrae]|uniref:Outer membrane protein beta-barrel domain-containing protein n=1 Tax=Spirosoma montaniterrae TaxID=1178516 RepID=A0A1P9WY73_9BACT|nr:outer membrane beta-barrel protein [Spirosoma montaniterrae]AQG80335.1 hypothetical protein AWR27_14010 [Spirosoma montaniterrae]
MRFVQYAFIAFLSSSVSAFAQGSFEGGIKGGGTFTHGYTTIPAIPLSATASTPQLNNKSNGIGTGYLFGLWGRKNFDSFYLQVELSYSSFLLKQKTDLSITAEQAFVLAGQVRPSIIPAQTPTAVNIVSESTLRAVNVPILFGKKWADGKIRAFAGPNLLFTDKAIVNRETTASINSLSVSATTETNLKEPNPQNPAETALEVKPFTYAIEAGVGYTFLRRLDLDVRYALPIGGIYENTNITGYLGIATVALGIKLF